VEPPYSAGTDQNTDKWSSNFVSSMKEPEDLDFLLPIFYQMTEQSQEVSVASPGFLMKHQNIPVPLKGN